MKNIKILLPLVVLSLFVFSCQDAIDNNQPGDLFEKDVYTSLEDIQRGLNGVYSQLEGTNEISFTTLFTDEVKASVNNNSISPLFDQFLTRDSSTPQSMWYGSYAAISRANIFLDAIDVYQPKPGEEVAYNGFIAQAKVIRAWSHFRLLTYFSTDLTNDNALGCILGDHVINVKEFLPRSTNGEIFAFINQDLDEAFAVMNNPSYFNYANNTSELRKYLSPDFIRAFKARMAAYRGDYTTAKIYADELINKYSLATYSTYSGIWNDSNSNEVIFKLFGGSIGSIWATNNATFSGQPKYLIGYNLFSLLYNFSDGNLASQKDIRAKSFIESSSQISANPYANVALVGKYAQSSRGPLIADTKIFRVSEMYFIRAEVAAEQHNYSEVQAYLQALTDERFPVGQSPSINTPTSDQEAWAEILKQRRIELCFEGHRWVDLKRLAAKAGIVLDRNSADCHDVCDALNPATDYRFTLPIPRNELDGNTPIKVQQNPGYDSN